ncbi:MAG: hypothetical protein ACI81R_002505 [Bradymonadia bacterium]|jgi:hypothetical protein
MPSPAPVCIRPKTGSQWPFAVVRALLLCALAATGCSDEGEKSEGPCRSTDDCEVGERCVDAVCLEDGDASDAGEGSGDADAADALDATRDIPTDLVAPDTGDDGSGDLPDAVDTEPEVDIDYGPLTWTITPPDGATGVPVDVDILVTFNQPMNALRFIPSNVQLSPVGGDTIRRSLDWDPETFTLTVATADEISLLRAVTPYRLRLADFIQASTGETLGQVQFSEFATGLYQGFAFHEELAAAYAPTILQEVDTARLDSFSRIDFDGDLVMTNNLANANGTLPGWAYWDIVESRTHFFITYLYYYPASSPRATITFEHDFVAVQVVVQKLDEDPLGRLRAFTTLYHSGFDAWAVEEAFYPPGFNVTEGEREIVGRLPLAAVASARAPTLFIQAGRHSVCLPNAGSPANRCAPSEGERSPFEDDTSGVTWTPGEQPQQWSGVGDETVQYGLRSFVETFWALRNRTDDEDALFSGTTRYSAPAVTETELRPGDGFSFPTTLLSDAVDGQFGDLPFRLNASVDPQQDGVWFVDPAWFLASALSFPESFSEIYCFNPYLQIDRRLELPEDCTQP